MKKRIPINTDKSIYVIDPDEVLYFKCGDTSTTIYFTNNEELSVPTGLESIEKFLENEEFIRPHHAYLVNRNHILRLEMADGYTLVLTNHENIPVEARTQSEVLQFIKYRK
ncbi:MAG: LytTR family transcriptional regulator DNA-binding domain-containing protein [Bacteroidales bacterium]|nr:LytTR family transcriptional regulator DNA-binding domain-containing protein [Bacteroidales bacterium]